MPRKGYKQTEQHRKKLSEAQKHFTSIYGSQFKNHKHSKSTRRRMSEITTTFFLTHENSFKGHKHSEASRRKIGEARKGKKLSLKTRKKISKGNKGKHDGKLSFEHRKKLSKAQRKFLSTHEHQFEGFKHSESTRKKMSLDRKGRKLSEATKQKISEALKGENAPSWKGGITPLYSMIRHLDENKDWRIGIFQRDHYTCQECNQNGGNLEAHHKKAFVSIFRKFLQKYNQFSPIEDKETLVRLAFTYEPFWDIDNGITLCKKCHDLTRKKVLIIE